MLLNQVSSPTHETPTPTTSRIEADVEVVPVAVAVVENQIENEPSTSQLKETETMPRKSDEGTDSTFTDSNVLK